MYSVKIRDHIMIAHSLEDEYFGPAQQLHGATYIVDLEFFSEQLNDKNVVIDIAVAHNILKEVLEPINYQNLDSYTAMQGQLTTTEFLAKYIHGQVRKKVNGDFSGRLKVTLGESHIAWASYEA